MVIRKKSKKLLGIMLMAMMSMGIFVPVAGVEKNVKTEMPQGCGEVAQHAISGVLIGAIDGVSRAFTTAYLNQVLFSKFAGKQLGTVLASLTTNGCFEIIERMMPVTPKHITYNTAYYTGLIPTYLALTPEFARHEKKITEIGNLIKKTFCTASRWALNLFSKGVNKLDKIVNKTDKKVTPPIIKLKAAS